MNITDVENEEAPLCNIREVCGEDLGSPTTMFSSRSQSQNFSQYDAAAAFRAVAFNEDVESYEVGYPACFRSYWLDLVIYILWQG